MRKGAISARKFFEFMLVVTVLITPFSASTAVSKQSALASSNSFRLMVYVPVNDPTAMSITQSYVTYPTDMEWAPSQYFPNVQIISGGPSLAVVNSTAHFAKWSGAKAIAYDFEHWSRTPLIEQADPVKSIDTAAAIAHSYGVKFVFVPDGPFMYNISNGVPYYQLYHWKNIDYLDMQVYGHRFAGGGSGTNVAAFASNVQNAVNYVKAQNPNIVIFVGLSFRVDSPLTLIQKTQAITSIADGVSYYYGPNLVSCANCTPANLQLVLHSLRPGV